MVLRFGSQKIANAMIFTLILPLIFLIQSYIIPAFEENVYQNKKNTTRYAVEIAIGAIERIYGEFKNGKITEEEARSQAINTLNSIRYNGREYFWVNDFSPVMIMHPTKPELNGKDLSKMADSNGKLLFLEMVDTVKNKGGGFVKYTWPKPNSEESVQKISYVKEFKPWGWIIGNGVYIDDIEAEMNAITIRVWTVIGITMAFAGVIVFSFSRFLEAKRIKEESVQLELVKAKMAQQTAEDLALKKTKFLDIAAHELRTPVTSLSLILQVSLRQIEKEMTVTKEVIDRLKAPTDRLKSLVSDLLDMSRLERGLVEIARVRTDIVSLIERCVEDFRLQAPGRSFIFNKPEGKIELDLDPVRINQVLSNILDNAIKYTEQGDIEVVVEDKVNMVRVSIVDHGPGISQEQQEALFSAFSRGNTEATIRASGLGLGLSVSQEIMHLHGGKIGLNSCEGKGCTFYFEIPKS